MKEGWEKCAETHRTCLFVSQAQVCRRKKEAPCSISLCASVLTDSFPPLHLMCALALRVGIIHSHLSAYGKAETACLQLPAVDVCSCLCWHLGFVLFCLLVGFHCVSFLLSMPASVSVQMCLF